MAFTKTPYKKKHFEWFWLQVFRETEKSSFCVSRTTLCAKKSNFACKQFFWKILGYFPNKIWGEKNLLSPSKNASHTNSVFLFIIWCFCCYKTKLGIALDFFNLFDKIFLSSLRKKNLCSWAVQWSVHLVHLFSLSCDMLD